MHLRNPHSHLGHHKFHHCQHPKYNLQRMNNPVKGRRTIHHHPLNWNRSCRLCHLCSHLLLIRRRFRHHPSHSNNYPDSLNWPEDTDNLNHLPWLSCQNCMPGSLCILLSQIHRKRHHHPHRSSKTLRNHTLIRHIYNPPNPLDCC